MNSNVMKAIGAVAAVSVLGLAAAYAQSNNPFAGNKSNQYFGDRTVIPANVHATSKDAPGKAPDPKRVTFQLPANIKWRPNDPEHPGEADVANVYGDPSKPGPYAVFYRWHQGSFSRPHYHDKIRHAIVVSGTWWVSSSSTYDEKTTVPLRAGATATDEEYGIHWDGSRSGDPEPAVLYLYGEGPVATVFVDKNGKPLPK
jgi:hypothetical protein